MVGEAIVMAPAADASEPPAADRLARLFDRHHARLYRLARRMVRTSDEARDVVQDTFLRAARSPRSIPDGPSHEEAWLVRVLVNICRDGWRKESVRRRLAGSTPAEPEIVAPESALIARTTVWRALDALPPRRRAVVVLYEIESTPIPVIAGLLGISSVTVRWHLSVGRRELARFLGSQL